MKDSIPTRAFSWQAMAPLSQNNSLLSSNQLEKKFQALDHLPHLRSTLDSSKNEVSCGADFHIVATLQAKLLQDSYRFVLASTNQQNHVFSHAGLRPLFSSRQYLWEVQDVLFDIADFHLMGEKKDRQ